MIEDNQVVHSCFILKERKKERKGGNGFHKVLAHDLSNMQKKVT